MDVGSRLQLSRPLEVSGPSRHVPPLGQAAVIDPLPATRPLQRFMAARSHASRVSFTHSRDIMVRLFFAPPFSGAFAL